jgi:hypothetical protein
VEHDLVASARGNDLPVATAQGFLGPPSILNQPRLADRVNHAPVDDQWTTVVADSDGNPSRNRQTARTAHRSALERG